MFLNDINKSPNTIFKQINQYLEKNYGFRVSENAKHTELSMISEKIQEEITELKIQGDDARKSPEISKRLLILEGIRALTENIMMQSPELEQVISNMADYVYDSFCLSGTCEDDFNKCVGNAMDVYRGSPYTFPDQMIQERVKQCAMERLKTHFNSESGEAILPVVGENNSDRYADLELTPQRPKGSSFDEILSAIKHARSNTGLDGYGNPINPKKRHDITAPDWELEPKKESQGVRMNEEKNLIKNLRKLLETEVSQAEIMMDAKGFAEELQEMIEKIGRLQNEDLPPVTDHMRETYGSESASAFQMKIYGALQSVMDSLYTAKTQVDDTVTNMAINGGAVDTSIDMEQEPIAQGAEGEQPEMPAGDEEMEIDTETEIEPGAEEETEEPLGRAKKMESVQELKKKVLEMQRLVSKAKKLKEKKK